MPPDASRLDQGCDQAANRVAPDALARVAGSALERLSLSFVRRKRAPGVFPVLIESEPGSFVLTRFLRANRLPDPDQVRGHAWFENALESSGLYPPAHPAAEAFDLGEDGFESLDHAVGAQPVGGVTETIP